MAQFIKSISTRWHFLAAILTAYIYFRAAPLQVDPHHDGIILGAAIGVADGHSIHSGVFSQYGPLPALLQGAVLALTSRDMLALRNLTAIMCLAIGFALYRLALKFVHEHLAKLTSLFWLLVSTVWVTQFPGALLPWPSLISTLLVMLGMIVLINSAQKNDLNQAILAGAFFGLAGFCRIQAFILLPLIVLYLYVKKQEQTRLVLFSMIGYFLSILAIVGILVLNRGLNDFIHQVFVTPLTVYPALGQSNNYNRFQFLLYIIEAIGFLILFFATSYVLKRTKSTFLSVIVVSICIFGIGLLGNQIAKSSLAIRFKVLFGEPLQNLVISPFYFAAASSAFLALILFISNSKSKKQIGFSETVAIIVSVGTLPQLYPQPDVMHLWWVSPIFLCGLLINVKTFDNTRRNSFRILQTILTSCIILGSIAAIQFIERPWSEYKLGVLKGTYALEEKARSLDIFKKIESVAVVGQTSFDCHDGIYAVSNGTYLPVDEWFVNWGFAPTEIPKIGSVRIICDQPRQYAVSEGNRLEMRLSYYKTNEAGKSIAVLRKIG